MRQFSWYLYSNWSFFQDKSIGGIFKLKKCQIEKSWIHPLFTPFFRPEVRD